MGPNEELVIAAAGGPQLAAVKCARCGFVDFPPQAYGCRQCGAHGADLARLEILAAGTVVSRAEVYAQEKTGQAPSMVAAVRLDAGPAIRVIMRPGESPAIGDAVEGVLVPGDGVRFVVKGG